MSSNKVDDGTPKICTTTVVGPVSGGAAGSKIELARERVSDDVHSSWLILDGEAVLRKE